MDDDMYGHHTYHPMAEYSDKAMISPDNFMFPNSDYSSFLYSSGFRDHRIDMASMFAPDELLSADSAMSEAVTITPELHRNIGSSIGGEIGGTRDEDVLSVTKAKIASHPSYPRLLEAYIDFQKVGAPPEISNLLDEIRRENELWKGNSFSTCVGADPELDKFMDTYCDMLVKCKSDLARPFDEATDFLNKMEMQLTNLCQGSSIRGHSGEGVVLSDDDEFSGEEIELPEAQQCSLDRDLKARLLHRFGNHISSLKLEFSKKKKKGKLPREARQTLLEWWKIHYKWPYPTEADKIALAETTGLDPRQINNWFINQRKRHWNLETI